MSASPAAPSVPTTMRAVVTRFLRAPLVKTIPVPTPEGREVLVKVSVCSLNPHDWKAMMIAFTRQIVGLEFSGVIVSAPLDSHFKPGDRVSGGVEHRWRTGGCAEYLVADPDVLFVREEGATALQGAAVTVAWLTAALGVEQRLVNWAKERSLPEDGPVIVYSANSCTGQYALQYLRHHFPQRPLIALASPASHDLLKTLGASICLPYTLSASELKAALVEKGFTAPIQLAYDTYALGDSVSKCEALMTEPGKIVTTLPRPNGTKAGIEKEHVFAFTVFNTPIRLLWMSWPAIPADHELGTKRIAELTELMKPGGVIKHMATQEIGGLEGVAEGLRLMKSGKVRGKKLVAHVADE